MNAQSRRSVEKAVNFTDAEADYLSERGLGRLATVTRSLEPHVVPVAYSFDGTDIYFSGWNLAKSLKYRNILENNKVAFVVDDFAPTTPWMPRGIEVVGVAEPITAEGRPAVRIVPIQKRSWGLEGR